VEITEEEQELYQKKFGLELELEWNQDGCCKLLKDDDTGCSLGDDRPLFCKLFPLNENTTGRLVLSNWSYLHCPKPQDYELDKVVDGKYHYKLKKKHKNKRDVMVLDDKIENVVKQIWLQAKDSIIQKYGQEYFDKIRVEMKQTIKHEFF
jgi:Fe-S-cluster containining protein